jgi:tryptophanyl-tRNA synthetase
METELVVLLYGNHIIMQDTEDREAALRKAIVEGGCVETKDLMVRHIVGFYRRTKVKREELDAASVNELIKKTISDIGDSEDWKA